MSLTIPEARALTHRERETLRAMLRAFDIDVAHVKAQVFPSLVVMPGGGARYVGRIFLLSNASLPIALARNAFGHYFPSMDGHSAASKFASLLPEMERKLDKSSEFRAAYLASPLTNEYCVAAVKKNMTQVEWVARATFNEGAIEIESWSTFNQRVALQLEARDQARQEAIQQIPARQYAPTN